MLPFAGRRQNRHSRLNWLTRQKNANVSESISGQHYRLLALSCYKPYRSTSVRYWIPKEWVYPNGHKRRMPNPGDVIGSFRYAAGSAGWEHLACNKLMKGI